MVGLTPVNPSLGQEADGRTKPTPVPMSQYQQRLARTDRMEVLGYPREWSTVQEVFHPFHPQRIVVLPSGTLLKYDYRCGHRLRKTIDEKIRGIESETWGRSTPLPSEKLESIYWIMDLMTGHYRVPDLFEPWVLGLVGRECLGTSALGQHFGVVHQFQKGDEIQVDNPPLDWWLFVFPEGIDWDDLGGESVHALIGHVSRFPFHNTHGETLYLAWSLTCKLAREVDDWRTISRMGRIDAARHLNEITVRLLEERNL